LSENRVLSENLKEKDHFEDLDIDRIILRWIMENGMRIWAGFIWLRMGLSSGLLQTQK
jgi:hypothetical protein